MVLRLLRTLPGDRRSCPRLRQRAKGTPRRHQHRDARTMRLDRPCRRRSSVGACPSITSHPNAPDDAQRPSSMRRDSDREARIPIKRKNKICAGGRGCGDVVETANELRVSAQGECGMSRRFRRAQVRPDGRLGRTSQDETAARIGRRCRSSNRMTTAAHEHARLSASGALLP